jgi:hypothetical protein
LRHDTHERQLLRAPAGARDALQAGGSACRGAARATAPATWPRSRQPLRRTNNSPLVEWEIREERCTPWSETTSTIPTNWPRGQAQLDEFQALHDRQPGALGTLVADAGNYRWITINLGDSQEHAAAALPGLIPYVQRLIEPQLARPSQLIAAGRVTVNTLTAHQVG